MSNDLVNNVGNFISRLNLGNLLGITHEGNRNLYKIFGYKVAPTAEDLYVIYERNDIANRIGNAFPKATWREDPQLSDDKGKTDEDSIFVKETNAFFKNIKAYSYLERADRMTSFGRFSILFLGFRDGGLPSEPLNPGPQELMYMSPYNEISTDVSRIDIDENSERFGLPLEYSIKQTIVQNGKQTKSRVMKIHHSRVIHIAENLEEDEVYGKPKLLPVYNRLMDLEKVVGGSAEVYWLNSRGGLKVIAKDNKTKIPDKQLGDMKEQVEDFQNQLTRMITGVGLDIDPINMGVSDPTQTISGLLDLIAGTVEIPKRILIGSERGELASAQDENNFLARVQERQDGYAKNTILRPFIDKMIETGNIPMPVGDYDALWESDSGLSPMQEADINLKKSQTLATYMNANGAEMVVPVEEFRVEMLGFDPEVPDSEFEIEDDLEEDTKSGLGEKDQVIEDNILPKRLSFKTG